MTRQMLLLMLFAASLFVMAGVILNRRLQRDAILAGRVRDVQRSVGIEAVVAPANASLPRAQRLIAGIGEAITRGGLLSAHTLEDLELRLAAAGFRGRTALASFIGAKLLALVGLPLLGWLMDAAKSSGRDAEAPTCAALPMCCASLERLASRALPIHGSSLR